VAADETGRDYVLNNLRLGTAALAADDPATAEQAFLRAYEVMNATGVNQGGREAAAVWLSEDLKIWKGEPYERAVANLHLGLIYYGMGDYENARGAFENALFKLRDYAEGDADEADYREVESSFAAAHVMLGRTMDRLGRRDLAAQHFERVRQAAPYLSALADPAVHARSNVLVAVPFGLGPTKASDGPAVRFTPSPTRAGPMPRLVVRVDGEPMDVRGFDVPTFDSVAMAQDRRWQDIDTIRATKDTIGKGLMVGGALVAANGADKNSGDTVAAGAGMALVGLLLQASSRPDLRVWESAPRGMYLVPLDLPPGEHEVWVGFEGAPHQASARVVAEPGGDALLYLLPQRWNAS
jgi:hypothetical protein